jgi:signal transduction histidine kinase
VFKSLQSRLTLSYLAIIVVCLLLVGLAALVLLRGYQRNLSLARLADRSVLATRLAGDMLRRDVSPQQTVQTLYQQMNSGDGPAISVYLLDATGRVIAGSDRRLSGQRFEDLALGGTPLSPAVRRGERQLPGGERVLYVTGIVAGDLPGEGQGAAHVLLLAQSFRPARRALGDLLPRLVGAGAIAFAVSLVLAGWMAYSIARPLERIAGAAAEIAAGKYDQQLQIEAPTEVARLAGSFNSMASQVKVTLQSQQDLLANVSHELKTPLTSIQGFSQALLDGTAGERAAQERAATIIHEEAGRMRRLVDDLLELARLEAGQVVMAQEAVHVGEVLQECVTRFSALAERLEVDLEIEMGSGLPLVTGDADRLCQLFSNLVDNALKHVQGVEGRGRVTLQAIGEDRSVVCSVTDNGPGIPANELDRIFERFYQVDKSRVRKRGGAGLGLSIAQEIAQAHGGQIWVESVQGLGTRFVVELPVCDDAGRV